MSLFSAVKLNNVLPNGTYAATLIKAESHDSEGYATITYLINGKEFSNKFNVVAHTKDTQEEFYPLQKEINKLLTYAPDSVDGDALINTLITNKTPLQVAITKNVFPSVVSAFQDAPASAPTAPTATPRRKV